MLKIINDIELECNFLYQTTLQGNLFTGISYKLYQPSKQYPCGQVCEDMSFYEGLDWGFKRRWYRNGILENYTPQRNNSNIGLCREWHSNGHLRVEYFIERGITTKRKEWNKKGEIISSWGLPEDEYNITYQNLQIRRGTPLYEPNSGVSNFEREVEEYLATHPSDRVYYEQDFLID